MSTKDKREILQNAPFGIAAGFMMGGPIGAVITGLTTIGLATIEDSQNRELLRRRQEQDIQNQLILEEKRLDVDRKLVNSRNAYDVIRDCVSRCTEVTKLKDRLYVSNDPILNRSNQKKISPDGVHNHVLLHIYENSFGKIKGETPVLAKGLLMSAIDFSRDLLTDVCNDRFELFDCCNQKFYGLNTFFLRYMYTVDGGITFKILV